MGLLTGKKLLEKEKLQIVKVLLGQDEKGEEEFVFVKQMTGKEREQFEQSLLKKIMEEDKVKDYEYDPEDFRAKLAVACMCDENGNLLLKPKDYSIFSLNISAVKLYKIVDEAQKINVMDLLSKDLLIKNSGAGPGDNSSSGSVKN